MNAIYARQSVEREDSISIESQLEACRYEAKGEPCREYADVGFSGKNTDRPHFQELIADVKKGEISKVIVYRLDRISRSILDFAGMMTLFSDYRVEFVSSTEKFDTSTPIGRAMLNICMVFAQLERETIQQRVTDAYYSRSGRGFYMGGRVPYGFRLKETLLHGKKTKAYVPCEEEADQVRALYGLYSGPGVSYGDIADCFRQRGLTRRGKPWSRARIADCLKNPIYVKADLDVYEFFRGQGTVIESPQEDFIGKNGCYYYKGRGTRAGKRTQLKDSRLVLAPHEGIVPSEVWLACRAKCLRNRQVQSGRKARNTWLAGLIKCGVCRYALVYKKYRARRARYFLCSRKMDSGACPGAGVIHADDLEGVVSREIVRRLEEFPILLPGGDALPESPEAAALRRERALAEQELGALTEKVALADGALLSWIGRRMEELAEKSRELDRALAGLNARRESDAQDRGIRGCSAMWSGLTLDEKRRAADLLIEVIYATSEEVQIYWRL